MLVIVPEPGTFGAFESAFDAQKLDAVVAALGPAMGEVMFTFPKLQIHTHENLGSAFKALGMPSAFSSAADFSAMDGRTDLYLKTVVHDAFVNVNEAGTEAAAATAVVVNVKAAAEHLDATSPFYFLIRDKATGVVVFMARVVDPSVG